METSGSDRSKEPFDEKRTEPTRGDDALPLRLGGRAAELLDSRPMSRLAASLSVVLLLATLFLVYISIARSGEEPPFADGSRSGLPGSRGGGIEDPVPLSVTGDDSDRPSNPVSASVGRYLVQAGAFRDRANAEQVAASLREKLPGFEISILESNLHLVRVGPFRERSTADSTAWSVEDATGLTPVVIRLDPDE